MDGGMADTGARVSAFGEALFLGLHVALIRVSSVQTERQQGTP